jgi:hypothetical protein
MNRYILCKHLRYEERQLLRNDITMVFLRLKVNGVNPTKDELLHILNVGDSSFIDNEKC